MLDVSPQTVLKSRFREQCLDTLSSSGDEDDFDENEPRHCAFDLESFDDLTELLTLYAGLPVRFRLWVTLKGRQDVHLELGLDGHYPKGNPAEWQNANFKGHLGRVSLTNRDVKLMDAQAKADLLRDIARSIAPDESG